MIFKKAQGAQIPALGYGTFQLPGDACVRGVAEALRIGYRHIDTARIYGNEREVGQGIAASGVPRKEIFLTSKVWRDDLSGQGVRQSLETSLELLGTDYLDLYLIHWPNDAFPLEETLVALADLRKQGLIRQLGVSNFPSALFRKACSLAPVFTNQVEYHVMLGQEPVLKVAEECDSLVTAYSPIVRGRVNGDPVLQEIARRHGKTPAQVALRWLIEQPRVVAIPKSAHPERIRENFGIFDFELSPEDKARIAELPKNVRTINPAFAPQWDA